ncbi:MAG: hypothetical protein QOH46_3600 [Solirubrobacteraceae bacterium]|nr:hypothetical protein [Solirubrobacteraceae bacterium]MEA2249071.1 hypothetical protein [Solirubrobacteraceae bacterium]
MDRRLLAIYLNDHLAGSTAGVELARRARGNNRGTPYHEPLDRLATEIAEDRAALLDVMRRLGVGRDPVKEWAGWLAEKGGRLKRNGRLMGYSPLSRVVELEVLALGVEGKGALWRALERTVGGDPLLAGVDLEELLARADRQREDLERLRVSAADEAFGEPA